MSTLIGSIRPGMGFRIVSDSTAILDVIVSVSSVSSSYDGLITLKILRTMKYYNGVGFPPRLITNHGAPDASTYIGWDRL